MPATTTTGSMRTTGGRVGLVLFCFVLMWYLLRQFKLLHKITHTVSYDKQDYHDVPLHFDLPAIPGRPPITIHHSNNSNTNSNSNSNSKNNSNSNSNSNNNNNSNSNSNSNSTTTNRHEAEAKAVVVVAPPLSLDAATADDGCRRTTNDPRHGAHRREQQYGTKVTVPLRPPYYIIQHGAPRSGSTYQTQLLVAIVDLKTHQHQHQHQQHQQQPPPRIFQNSPNPQMGPQQRANRHVPNKGRTNQIYQGTNFYHDILTHGFVQKSHESLWVEKTICELERSLRGRTMHTTATNITIPPSTPPPQLAIFTSVIDADEEDTQNYYKYDVGYIVHEQVMNSASFRQCASCEIAQYYQDLFALTAEEVRILQDYMTAYEVLRQCCGLQQSKYNRLRLHGCNVTPYQQLAAYPWCERHDLDQVEQDFEMLLARYQLTYRTPMGRLDPNPNLWHQRGDCQNYERQIIEDHLDFNGARFDGNCALESVDTALKKRQGKQTLNESTK